MVWGARWKRQVEQALRFKNAAADNAQSVDLLVTVAEESDYRVNKATSDGSTWHVPVGVG